MVFCLLDGRNAAERVMGPSRGVISLDLDDCSSNTGRCTVIERRLRVSVTESGVPVLLTG